ncbi:hypothetical protein [Caldalkalibacillus mannanilyticus]
MGKILIEAFIEAKAFPPLRSMFLIVRFQKRKN